MAKFYYKREELTFQPVLTYKNSKDLTGKVFNRLTVLGYAGKYKWFCECECGNIVNVLGWTVAKSLTKSCGCLVREKLTVSNKKNAKHGMRNTPEYRAFISAKTRCANSKQKGYANYGGRGIEFRFTSFEEFFDALGFKPTPKHSVDQINNDGHYEKGNVRWVTMKEQMRNIRKNRFLSIQGVTRHISEWAEASHLSVGTIYRRLRRGWCEECATLNPSASVCVHKSVSA